MSTANALNNAISGLRAAARGTEVISSNLANALTPGYARREVELSPRILANDGGGVHVTGVKRIVSEAVLSDFRMASSNLAKSNVRHEFYATLEASIGMPQNDDSLTARVTALQTALVSGCQPTEGAIRLRGIFEAASDLVGKINAISDTIQSARTNADHLIAKHVKSLDQNLNEVAKLNRHIIVERANGRDASSLMDARQSVIDQIAKIVPIREMQRDNGRVSLFTAGGMVLLDGKSPVKIEFNPTGRITPDIDEHSAQLGQILIDGEALSNAKLSLMSGGALSELFELRDNYAVKAQASVDALARELHDRFAYGGPDSTIPPSGSGLFTDGNLSFDPSNERGLSARLKVNSSVDERSGGELWRIQHGVYASDRGDAGDARLIQSLADRLTEIQPFASASLANLQGDITTVAGDILSATATERLSAEREMTHDQTFKTTLQDTLHADAVDSDAEMERLLQLEQAYAANAKVIQAIDEMLKNILRI